MNKLKKIARPGVIDKTELVRNKIKQLRRELQVATSQAERKRLKREIEITEGILAGLEDIKAGRVTSDEDLWAGLEKDLKKKL